MKIFLILFFKIMTSYLGDLPATSAVISNDYDDDADDAGDELTGEAEYRTKRGPNDTVIADRFGFGLGPNEHSLDRSVATSIFNILKEAPNIGEERSTDYIIRLLNNYALFNTLNPEGAALTIYIMDQNINIQQISDSYVNSKMKDILDKQKITKEALYADLIRYYNILVKFAPKGAY